MAFSALFLFPQISISLITELSFNYESHVVAFYVIPVCFTHTNLLPIGKEKKYGNPDHYENTEKSKNFIEKCISLANICIAISPQTGSR